jgi:hypothetical protein
VSGSVTTSEDNDYNVIGRTKPEWLIPPEYVNSSLEEEKKEEEPQSNKEKTEQQEKKGE